MKNTLCNRLVATLMLAFFCAGPNVCAAEVTKARFGSLRRDDLVVVDVQGGLSSNTVSEIVQEYDRTVIVPRESQIAPGHLTAPVTSVNSQTGAVLLTVYDIEGAVDLGTVQGCINDAVTNLASEGYVNNAVHDAKDELKDYVNDVVGGDIDLSAYPKAGTNDAPVEGWYFRTSSRSVVVTNDVDSIETNSYSILSLYNSGTKVWTSDPDDSTNRGWLVWLAVLLATGVGAFAWRSYVTKDYLKDYIDSLSYTPITAGTPSVSPNKVGLGTSVSSVTLSWTTSGSKAVSGYLYGPGLPTGLTSEGFPVSSDEGIDFSDAKMYAPGDFVKYSGTYYCCVRPHDKTAWASADFKALTANSMGVRRLTAAELSAKSALVAGTFSFPNLTVGAGSKWGIVLVDGGSPDALPAAAAPSAVAPAVFNYIYHGKARMPSSGIVDLTFIETLTSVLQGTRVTSFTPNAGGDGEYAWYALPKRIGKCSFSMGGVPAAFGTVGDSGIPDMVGGTVYTISLSNVHGAGAEDYYVYRSYNDATVTGTVAVGAA